VYHAEAGKLSRMRENNLWLLDPPEHFTANFLTYENMVAQYVARVAQVWQQHTGRPMALLHQHLLAAAFQLQVRLAAVCTLCSRLCSAWLQSAKRTAAGAAEQEHDHHLVPGASLTAHYVPSDQCQRCRFCE
jgi:hypothetical protein